MTLPPRNGTTLERKPDAKGGTVVDALAFSALLPAAIAFVFSWVSSLALGSDPTSRVWLDCALLAASGSFVVYSVDRLRDRERDGHTSPHRTAFTNRHEKSLFFATALAGVVLVISLAAAPFRITLLCAATGAVGLLHRRLKTFAAIKTLYVSLAWTAICAGIPWLSLDLGAAAGLEGVGDRDRQLIVPLAAVLFTSVAANLIASNLRDDEAHLLRSEPRHVLNLARFLALLGLTIAMLSPAPLPALAWIPAFELVALGFFRSTEHYGHLGVDGALLLGALASLVHQGLI